MKSLGGISLLFLTTAGESFILKLKKKIPERLIFLSEDLFHSNAKRKSWIYI